MTGSLSRRRFLAAAALAPVLATNGVTISNADPIASDQSNDLPYQLDRFWNGRIPQGVTTASSTPTIPSAVELIHMAEPINVTPGGGAELRPVDGAPGTFEFGWRFPGTAVNYGNPRGWFVQFNIRNATDIEFLVYTSSGGKKNAAPAWNLMIDDQRVWDYPSAPPLATDAFNLVKFTLPDRNPHSIRFYMNSLALKSVFANPGASAKEMPLRGGRAMFLGDSTTQGTSQNTGWEAGSWLWRFAAMIGVDDAWNGGLGGTGFIADSNGQLANYLTRASTDVAPANPALVFVSSYFNDKTKPVEAISANTAHTLDVLRDLPSSPRVVVTGAYDPSGSTSLHPDYVKSDAAIRTECFTRGIPYIEPTTGTVYDGAGNPLGRNLGPWVTSASRAELIGPDNMHMTDFGCKYYAYRLCEAYRAIGTRH